MKNMHRAVATVDLAAFGEAAVPALRLALKRELSAEVRQRVKQLIAKINSLGPADLQQMHPSRF